MPQAVRVLILTALETEARAIARAFHWSTSLRGDIACQGDCGLAIAGLKACRLEAVVADLSFQVLIMAGLAGALSPALQVGDLVADGDFPADFPLPDSAIRLHRGRIHTASHLVSSPAEKQVLFVQTGALAVDMETECVRSIAAKRGVPFLALRAISDAASDPLDPDLLTLIDARGRPRPARAAGMVLRHPAKLPELLRIARASRHALSHLSAVLVAVLASGWPEVSRETNSPQKKPA